ncbi:Zn(II)2Cys6 transcription factor [Aspergillus saccharolyticus JOP 1030-1]|uniref:Zn(2)-C6 fungal-type domain-containing protein n=1 Tax=Aspergillus saccharolyticus JOP 1030-1 TaxID=1450539 RepID=A0A319A8G2_9EURO|nr:hypothetical protein BP01DRAFT_103029 [Aspergillus saccharolyticus JOP 1030-1]PYH43372.1 hypothetical protein BP01DRAFT_103029 [Aspergillus saccharolyticus JOP 1030-1]
MFHTFDLNPKLPKPGKDDRAPAGHNDRVRTACELCRQMKVKCDGAHPCKHCAQFFHECIYRHPRRKRQADLDHGKFVRPGKRPKLQENSNEVDGAAAGSSLHVASQQATPIDRHDDATQSDHLEARHHGSSGERSFIERLKIEFGDWPNIEFESRLRVKERIAPRLFLLGPQRNLSIKLAALPPHERAEPLVNRALDAHLLYHALHRPTFASVFRLLYSLDKEDYGETEKSHIPLLYALMAVGCLFERHTGNNAEQSSESSIAEGLRYFEICRDSIDLDACDNLFAMQAIFFMNLFLISTCRLSRCYTYVSHMLSLALRMGLHQPGKTDSSVVSETKKSLFWAIWQLLVTVASMCGLPKPIPADEIGIDYPEDVAADFDSNPLTSKAKENGLSSETISSHLSYVKLHEILYNIVKSLYPPSTKKDKDASGLLKHFVTKHTIFKFEDELRSWTRFPSIRAILGKHEDNLWVRRARYELCMTYAHNQVYLYRPFMHYLLEYHNQEQEPQQYAIAGIRASCNIIRLAQDMQRHGLLFGAQWRVAHMLSTSALTLLYVLLICKPSTLAPFLKAELDTARAMMMALRPYCIHSQRTHIAVTVLATALSDETKVQDSASVNDQADVAREPHYVGTRDLVARTFANSSSPEDIRSQAEMENVNQQKPLRYPWEQTVQSQSPAANAASQRTRLPDGHFGDSSTFGSAQSLIEGIAAMSEQADVRTSLVAMQPEMTMYGESSSTTESTDFMEARPYIDQHIYEQFDYYAQSVGYENINFYGGDDLFYPFDI